MHNDRDRTQYDGSQAQGRFRGFTAGQEGWLTDGEHGITGVSPERIFEFPEVKKKRRKNKKKPVRYVQVLETFALAADASRLVESHKGCWPGNWFQLDATGRSAARGAATYRTCYTVPSNAQWLAWAQTVAEQECVDQGYERAQDGAATVAPSTPNWRYERRNGLGGAGLKYRASRLRQYTATCEKTVYRRATDDD